MPKLIKDGVIVDNSWLVLAKPQGDETVDVPAGQVIVPVSVWQEQRDTLSQRKDIGVWLDSDCAAEDLGADAAALPLIAINFPVFMDGRGFSLGRLLRERFDFNGELRAIGNFMRDQLFYLKRCGFNAFDCNEDIDPEAALASLSDFSESYQAAADQPVPLFRRR